MKNSGRITGMLLMLFIASSFSLNAQRGMRGMRPDSAMMNRMERMQPSRMAMRPDMDRMNMEVTPPYAMRHQRQGFNQPGMGGMRGQGMGMHQSAPGMQGRMPQIYNIPNLTDKQKKDIADLRGKQQAEMEKLRIDMQTKMKELRDSHKAKVISILNDEQKKWFEENNPKPVVK
jgi:hypothetical protein